MYLLAVYSLLLVHTAQSQTGDETDIISFSSFHFFFYVGIAFAAIHSPCSTCYIALEIGLQSDIMFFFLFSAPFRKMQNTCV